MNRNQLKELLNKYYLHYKRKFSSKDPVWTLHEFPNEKDIEILGLIISSYSYGSVDQINAFINRLLNATGNNVYEFTLNFSEQKDKKRLNDLCYRFNTGKDLINLFRNVKSAVMNYGNLRNLFLTKFRESDENILPALQFFSKQLNKIQKGDKYYPYLFPDPQKGSACKRLNLYLRWMVRKDEIDLGIWRNEIPASKLIIPVDTHVYKIAKKLKLVKRKTYDIKFAIELTEKLKLFDPHDPVKYDFALCHISLDKKLDEFFL